MMEDEVKTMMRALALLFSKVTTLKWNFSRLFRPDLPLRGFASWELVRACGLVGSRALPTLPLSLVDILSSSLIAN